LPRWLPVLLRLARPMTVLRSPLPAFYNTISCLRTKSNPPCYASHFYKKIRCSVLFNFLGRDFFNALSAKDQEKFAEMLVKWLAALFLGIPVFVLR
jgi:hypothetical protein